MSVSVDIYALGAVLTEFFGGKPIWQNMSSHAIIYKVAIEGTMPMTDHSPKSIRNVVRRCLCPLEERITAEVLLKALFDIDA